MKENKAALSTFAKCLRIARGAESQTSFASQICVHPRQYSKYERGLNSPSVDVLMRICRVTGCSADWLLGLMPVGTPITFYDLNRDTYYRHSQNGRSTVSISNSPGAAVANGRNARASVGPSCEQCPFKMLAMEFKDRAAKLPRKR